MKTKLTLFIGGVLLLLLLGIGYRWNSPSQEPSEQSSMAKPQSPAKFNQPRSLMSESEVEEVETLLNPPEPEEVLMIDGIPLMRVLGGKKVTDPETGVIKITEVVRVNLVDGSHLLLSPEGTVTYDPVTGKVGIDALNTQLIQAEDTAK